MISIRQEYLMNKIMNVKRQYVNSFNCEQTNEKYSIE